MSRKLSEPQQSLVNKLQSGARLNHSTDGGLFRLQDGSIERTIHPATVGTGAVVCIRQSNP